MELKRYQKQAIRDLSRYLEILNETRDMSAAFRDYWAEKGVTVGPMPICTNLVLTQGESSGIIAKTRGGNEKWKELWLE